MYMWSRFMLRGPEILRRIGGLWGSWMNSGGTLTLADCFIATPEGENFRSEASYARGGLLKTRNSYRSGIASRWATPSFPLADVHLYHLQRTKGEPCDAWR